MTDIITLRKENVVKETASADVARSLEEKGFVRDGTAYAGKKGIGAEEALEKEVSELRKQLEKASAAVASADERRGEAEQELAGTKERLEAEKQRIEALEREVEETKAELKEAVKKAGLLEQELAGTKEQLEAAVKKNASASGKGK